MKKGGYSRDMVCVCLHILDFVGWVDGRAKWECDRRRGECYDIWKVKNKKK